VCLKGSIGKPLPGCVVKLSEGDRGEILVKSRTMFTQRVAMFQTRSQREVIPNELPTLATSVTKREQRPR
jgi:hypothetical protein